MDRLTTALDRARDAGTASPNSDAWRLLCVARTYHSDTAGSTNASSTGYLLRLYTNPPLPLVPVPAAVVSRTMVDAGTTIPCLFMRGTMAGVATGLYPIHVAAANAKALALDTPKYFDLLCRGLALLCINAPSAAAVSTDSDLFTAIS